MISSFLALLTAATTPAVIPDGARLRTGDSCYATTLDGKPDGIVLRRITRSGDANAPWTIVIRSQFAGETPSETVVVLAYRDLQPIALRNGDIGRPHTMLAFSDGRVTGVETVSGKGVETDLSMPAPFWETTSGAFLATALPLAPGATFELPIYVGTDRLMTLRLIVTGSRSVDTPDGPVDAWTVSHPMTRGLSETFLIAKSDRRLLGVDVGSISSRLGGDCSELAK